jgi:hypothetical protein
LPDHENRADLNNLTMEGKDDIESMRSARSKSGKYEEEKM